MCEMRTPNGVTTIAATPLPVRRPLAIPRVRPGRTPPLRVESANPAADLAIALLRITIADPLPRRAAARRGGLRPWLAVGSRRTPPPARPRSTTYTARWRSSYPYPDFAVNRWARPPFSRTRCPREPEFRTPWPRKLNCDHCVRKQPRHPAATTLAEPPRPAAPQPPEFPLPLSFPQPVAGRSVRSISHRSSSTSRAESTASLPQPPLSTFAERFYLAHVMWNRNSSNKLN